MFQEKKIICTCGLLFLHFAKESGIFLYDVVNIARSVTIHRMVVNELVGFNLVPSSDGESCSQHSGAGCDGFSANGTSRDFGSLEAPSAKSVRTVEHLLVVGVVIAQGANDGGFLLNVVSPWQFFSNFRLCKWK